MGAQKLSPNFNKVCKTLYQAGKWILTHYRYLSSTSFIDKDPNGSEGSSVALKYTVAIYTGMPQKTLGTTLTINGFHTSSFSGNQLFAISLVMYDLFKIFAQLTFACSSQQ